MAVVNEGETRASAATEGCLDAVHSHLVFLYFKLFSELLNQLGLRHTAQLGVNHFDLALLSGHKRINEHFAHVKNELVSHLRY